MRVLAIPFFILYFTIGAFAHNFVLEGTVKDSNSGQTLVSATVSACGMLTFTDTEGYFSFELDEDECLFEVRYLGYETYSERIKLPLEDGKPFIVFMNPSQNILNQAVITANKFQERQSQSTVSLEVLKPSFFEQVNAPSVDQGLDLVPGVDILDGQANIRGGSGYSYGAGSRVLLVIDQMPALQYDGGYSQWDDIPTEMIAQVEVLKGASSVLYGSSAMNGVIQFTTEDPSRIPKTKAGISYRHFMAPEDTRRKWWTSAPFETNAYLSHSQKWKKIDFVAGGFYNKLNSYNQSVEENRGRAYAKIKFNINPKLFVTLNSNLSIGDNASFFYWGNALRKSFQPGDNTLNNNNITRYFIDPSAVYYGNNDNKHTFRSRFYSAKNVSDNNQTIRSQFQYASYNYQHTFRAIEANLIAGFEGLLNQTNAELYSNSEYTGSNAGVFLQWNQTLAKKLRYSLGARYEINQLSNPEFSYSLNDTQYEIAAQNALEAKPVFRSGINYEPFNGTYLRASIGQGYRYPTIAEKFTFTNAGGLTIIPNPDLESETGWSSEIGLRQEYGNDFVSMFLDVAYFYSQYNNMMEFTLSDQVFAGFQARNIGDTEIGGIESSIGAQWDLGILKIKGLVAHTYIDPKYRNFSEEIRLSATSEENILKYRYKHSFKSNLSISINRWSIWVNQRFNSHTISIDRNFEQFISGIADFRNNFDQGYNIWGFQAAYDRELWRASINLDNATNVLYTERPALLEAPRNVSLRLDFDITGKTK